MTVVASGLRTLALSARMLRQTPRLLRRAELCTRPGFSRYESGLQFRDTHVPESGRVADDGDLLSLHYSGRLEDGTLFDTSLDDSLMGNQPEFEGIPSEALLGWDRGHPLQFTLSNQEARSARAARAAPRRTRYTALGIALGTALCTALGTAAAPSPHRLRSTSAPPPQVIPGWEEGVHGMRVGGRRELIVPPELGYGEAGGGDKIPPNAVLHFEIELLDARDGAGLLGRLMARFNKFTGSSSPLPPRSSANFKPEDEHLPLKK